MSDFQPIIKHISRFVELTKEEQECFTGLLKITPVRKRQFIVQPGFVCRHMNYVTKGALRAYFIDNKGVDHTIALAVEDWWINDYSSYIFQEPATFFVEALEDCTLIQLSHDNEQLLYERIPKFERCFRITTQFAAASMQKRVLANISKTAEERYNEFAAKYPQLLSRIPQYAIASYLGFTKEFLSKIRNNKLKKS